MEATITFQLRLDRQAADGRCPISFRVCWGSLKVRGSIGEKVHPDQWDDSSQRVKRSAQVAKVINRRIGIYQDGIDDYFKPLLIAPTEQQVTEHINQLRAEQLGKSPKAKAPVIHVPAQPSFKQFAEGYSKLRRAERSKSWKESIDVLAGHLVAFRADLDWPDLKLNTLNQFTAYLQDDCEHSDATLETYVSLLRGMLTYAIRLGYPVPPDYQFVETRSVGDTLRPILTHADIDAIAAVKLTHSDESHPTYLAAIEATRWYFLLACATGLRYSDLHQLLHPTIIRFDGVPCLQVVQKKTGKAVPIPVGEQTLTMLHNPVPTSKPANMESYMMHLKVIGQQAGLERIVTVGSYYKGELMIDHLPLWDTLTSHMARRTFAYQSIAGDHGPQIDCVNPEIRNGR